MATSSAPSRRISSIPSRRSWESIGATSSCIGSSRNLLAGVVRALSSAIDAKDPYTCGHSDRVARVAVRLAEELGCDAKTSNTLYLAGLLHDVGKIGIDDNVLARRRIFRTRNMSTSSSTPSSDIASSRIY